MAGGKAVAKWGFPGGKVKLQPLQRLPAKTAAALEVDAADVTRFLTD